MQRAGSGVLALVVVEDSRRPVGTNDPKRGEDSVLKIDFTVMHFWFVSKPYSESALATLNQATLVLSVEVNGTLSLYCARHRDIGIDVLCNLVMRLGCASP